MSSWRVLIPEAATNLVTNPSLEGGATTGFTISGAGTTISVSTLYSKHGYRCLRIIPAAGVTDGVYYGPIALTNGLTYTFSVDFMGVVGIPYQIYFADAGLAAKGTPTTFTATGEWERPSNTWVCDATANFYLFMSKSGSASVIVYYVDGLQCVQMAHDTSYIDGDVRGFMSNGYYWNGTPHASTSTRSAQERSGGQEIDLTTTYAFKVKWGAGIGMPPINHHTQGMALLPGALYQGHKVQPRVLDLVSVTMSTTYSAMYKARQNFINAIKPDRVTPEQPTVFRFYGANILKPVEFYGYYDSGLEYNGSVEMVDEPVARFICYDPFCYEIDEASRELSTISSVADADEIIRKAGGVWANLSTDFTAEVAAIKRGIDGSIYIGGLFTNVGDANGDYIVKWNPATAALSSLGAGLPDGVNALAVAANGDVYIGGQFLNVTDANGDNITKWNGAAFSSLSTGVPDVVKCLAFGLDGSLYVGGLFVNVTDANGDYITKWDGTAFSSLGTGMDGSVQALAVAPNGDLYAGGLFANAGGVAAVGVAKWNGTAWSGLGAGLGGVGSACYALAADAAGNIYVGGTFTTADGVDANRIAKWNGRTFTPLGSGANGLVQVIKIDRNGLIYVGGLFTEIGGLSTPNKIAVWNGSAWAHLAVDLPGAATVEAVECVNDDIYIGYNTTGTAYASGFTIATNSGSAKAYPKIVIKRADDGTTAKLEYIRNDTTGATLWFDYAFQKGETITIDCTPSDRSITSSMRGLVWLAMLRNSDFSEFYLLPGSNNISVYVSTTGAPTITAHMTWKVTHWGADMVAV
jgi:hypothetical protein